MPTTADLMDLIDLVYDAALDPGAWPRVAAALAAALDADDATIETGPPGTPPSLRHLAPLQRAVAVVDLHPGVALRASLGRVGERDATLVVVRHRRTCFTARDVAFCEQLLPHLRRQLALRGQVDALEAQRAAARVALDHLPMGVLLVDGSGTVLHANSGAGALLARGRPLAVRSGKLVATDLQEDLALRATLATGAGGALVVGKRTQDLPWSLVVASMEAGRPSPGRPAVVFVHDPAVRVEAPAPVLASLYGLTPTEARVATRLVQGTRVEEIAAELAISVNTVRTHLKRIYGKTATESQAGVVRVLLSGPVVVQRTAESIAVGPRGGSVAA